MSLLKKEAVLEALQDISEEPLLGKPLNRNLSGRFSYRMGVNRIIYIINEDDRVVEILSAGHRSIVYGWYNAYKWLQIKLRK